MNLKEIIPILNLEIKAGEQYLDREVTAGYVSDVLSDVLTYAGPGNLWITRQVHLNIVPIAGARDIAAIIVVNSRVVEPEILEKAEKDKIPIFVTDMNAFQAVGKLYAAGIRGSDENV